MKILLTNVTIADTASPHNNTIRDLFFEDGKITAISNSLTHEADIKFDGMHCFVSPGWTDIFSNFCDPGFEFKETLASGAAAAAAGGYTDVFVLPDTKPAITNKAQVEYIINKSTALPVTIHPLGAISKNLEGKELAEMYDMKQSGAISFTDGLHALQSSAALLIKALLYVKAFDGTLIQLPVDENISKYGLMNEGIISTKLGLPGVPVVAEHIMIQRDIELLKYTGGKLHITGVSTAKGIELIKQAKADGLYITCSVTPYHLFFSDEDLQDYNTNLKVSPPLRTKEDVTALREAVINGLVDCIASHHNPQDFDNKVCEFEYAKNGMIGLQTCYAAVQTVLPQLTALQIAALFSVNARNIFKLPVATIIEGSVASLTIFDPQQNFTLTKENIKSKSNNSPFINKTLQGKVIAIINKGNLFLNK